jgi:DNA-binding GntR family transcriptional regulator
MAAMLACDHRVMPPDRPPVLPSQRVLADMRERISAGEWQPGDHMPSARDLAEHYHVSTRTVAKVYATLAAEGLVVVTPSWGTHRA